jgi:transcriptional regulator with XRE-family HTH domain
MHAAEPEPQPPARPKSLAAETLGTRVRALRTSQKISQETLADLAGVHWTFIGQVERGQRNITLHNLVRIADALATDPAELVTGIGIDQLPPDEDRETKADAIRRARVERKGPQ